MSILAYVGPPGAGKSYSVVENQLIPAIKEGRVVVTNLPLKLDNIKRDFPNADVREFPTDTVKAQPEAMLEVVPPGALLILDEVMKIFPAGTKANQVPEPYRIAFAEHRHRVDAAGRSSQIVLVCQDLNQIGTFARTLVEQTYRMVKLETLGVPVKGRYRVDIYPGPQAGPNPPAAQRIREIHKKYSPKIFQYYTSHTQSESAMDGANEDKVDKRANVFRRPFFIALPFIILAALGFVFWKGSYLLDKYRKKPEAPAAAALMPGGHQAPAAPAPPSPSFFSSTMARVEAVPKMRVVGVVQNVDHPERSRAMLKGEAGVVVVDASRCRFVPNEPAACLYEGTWYSESGRAWAASGDDLPAQLSTRKELTGDLPVSQKPG